MLEMALPMLSPGWNCGEAGAKPSYTKNTALPMGDTLVSSPPNEESPCPLLHVAVCRSPSARASKLNMKQHREYNS